MAVDEDASLRGRNAIDSDNIATTCALRDQRIALGSAPCSIHRDGPGSAEVLVADPQRIVDAERPFVGADAGRMNDRVASGSAHNSEVVSATLTAVNQVFDCRYRDDRTQALDASAILRDLIDGCVVAARSSVDDQRIAGGRIAPCFSVLCMRSWAPFCCGCAGRMR